MSREMKDSGIPWIGEIPQSWDIKTLGVFFRENTKDNHALVSTNSLQYKYGEIIQKPNNDRELNEQDIDLLKKYTLVKPDDIVVNGLNLNYDFNSLRIARVKENGIITSAYIVIRPMFEENSSFFNYLLKSLDYQKVFHGMGTGIRLTLKFKELSRMSLPIPPTIFEQTLIADYLDKKCAEIDKLIGLQEKMIDKLTTYKQSVITEAVTKGLDPNVNMKDSGVEWIAKIPEHWDMCRVKNICCQNSNVLSEKENSNFEFDYVDIGSVSFEKGIFNTEHYIFKNAPSRARRKAKVGDLIMSTVRTYLKAIDVIDNDEKAKYIYSTGFAILTPKPQVYFKFLSYISKSQYFLDQVVTSSKGINYPSINSQDLMKIYVITAPKSEQQSIADYLDKKCSEIDRMIEIKKEKIEKLNTYKKSIIFEYVTGKKEVPHA